RGRCGHCGCCLPSRKARTSPSQRSTASVCRPSPSRRRRRSTLTWTARSSAPTALRRASCRAPCWYGSPLEAQLSEEGLAGTRGQVREREAISALYEDGLVVALRTRGGLFNRLGVAKAWRMLHMALESLQPIWDAHPIFPTMSPVDLSSYERF